MHNAISGGVTGVHHPAPGSAIVQIDGRDYAEIDCATLPFTNACNFCAFRGTACYSRRDFDCHSDSRPDGRDVVFQLLPNDQVDTPRK
jgi:hypothetical protein